MEQAFGPTRVDRTPLVGLLFVLDILAITAFVAAGELSHGVDPLANIGRVAYALAPFLGSWLAVAILAGLYTEDAVASVGRVVALTVPAWAATVAIALAIRALPAYDGGVALTFAAVALGIGGSFVLGSRSLVALVRART
jgi:hypothetical protein